MNIVEPSTFDVILVGAHGSGKTTLGHQLARELEVPFHAELGREAMERRGPSCATVDAGQDFDAMLWAEEWDRDQRARLELRDIRRVRRVVETWHIGNAAYALLRPGTSTLSTIDFAPGDPVDAEMLAGYVQQAAANWVSARPSRPWRYSAPAFTPTRLSPVQSENR